MAAEALQPDPPQFRVRVMHISQAADLYLGELARQGRTVRTLASYRLDRRRSMETVRGLDWGANVAEEVETHG